ncbi:10653_t:CDS:2, partial [Scutellospora calospora]
YNLPKAEIPDHHPTSKFFGKGVSMANGNRWAQQRKIATPAFNRALRPEMVGDCTKDFITLLDKWTDTPMNVFLLMQRVTIQILGKLAFAYDMKALDNWEEEPYFLTTYRKIIPGILESAAQQDYKCINKELRDDIVIYFVAGHDTSSLSLSTVFYYLAKYPDIQKKAREEAINVLGSSSKLPTSDNLRDLKYITAIIMEALRLYPPATIIFSRSPIKPLNLSRNITIPEGTKLTVGLWQIQRNPDVWENVDEFIPERFMNPDKEIKSNWVAFSSGPRNCIGQNFSMMEQKIIIAMTLLNFEVSLPPNMKRLDKISLTSSFMLYPKELNVVFSKLK